jgi:hypothetical protein
VLVSGTNGIVVNTLPASHVVLDGLDIEGLTTGINGIDVLGQGTVIIRNCSIRNFTQNGVNVASISGFTQVLIQNSIITGNGRTPGFGGVNVVGASGAFNVADVVNSMIFTNTNFNVQANGVNGTANIVLAGSVLTGTSPNILCQRRGQRNLVRQ